MQTADCGTVSLISLASYVIYSEAISALWSLDSVLGETVNDVPNSTVSGLGREIVILTNVVDSPKLHVALF